MFVGTLTLSLAAWLPVVRDWGWDALADEVTGDLRQDFLNAPAAALVYGATGGIAYGLRATSANLATAASPKALLRRDRRTFILLALGSSVALTLVVTLGLWLAGIPRMEYDYRGSSGAGAPPDVIRPHLTWVVDPGALLSWNPEAISIAVVVGISLAFSQTAWGDFIMARSYMSAKRRLPLDLMAFLSDAHERRGVLRQAGGVYQFRHIEVQRRLVQPGDHLLRD
jgi:hypothetical protein